MAEKIVKPAPRTRWFERKTPTPPLADKGDTVKRLEAFIAYQFSLADEALRRLPTDPSLAASIIAAAHEHYSLAEKAQVLRRAFSREAAKTVSEG